MATVGDVRVNLVTQFPGINLDLLDNWIEAAYNSILDRCNWQHNDAEYVLTTAAEVNVGTVTVVQGSTGIVGLGTSWTAAMSGRMFRVAGDLEYYGFSYLSATTGTLDRPYLNANASGQGYRMNQNVVVLPAEARVIQQIAWQEFYTQPERETLQWLDLQDPGRNLYSDVTTHWAPYMDTQTSPPQPQITLWPVPTMARAGSVLYTVNNHFSLPLVSSQALLPWVNKQAVIELVRSSACATQADRLEAKGKAEGYIVDMLMREAAQQGPVMLKGDPFFKQRNLERAAKSVSGGPWITRLTGL